MPEEPREEKCCVCGHPLPNRYAVAGRCAAPGCNAAFCAMHWRRGDRLCPAHGGGTADAARRPNPPARAPSAPAGTKETKMTDADRSGRELCERADAALPQKRKLSILKQLGDFAVKLGQGAGAFAKKLAGIKSTDEALREIEEQIAQNRARREPLKPRHEELYKKIAAGKKEYLSAPPAKKKLLELELKSALAEYQSIERQIAAYLKNETILEKVRGRMYELVAADMKSITEDEIDKLTDRVEDAADNDENIEGAIGELDKAGVRRERDDGAFEDALAAFGEDQSAEEPAEAEGAKPAGEKAGGALDGALADF